MFNKSNFCHIASNNRNEQKGSVFIYKTADTLAQVTQSGYFNEKLIDINLHDLIIHVQYNPVDRTLKKSVLIVTERTLDNVETAPILDQTIGDDIDQLGDQVAGIEEKIPGAASAANQLADKAFVNDIKTAIETTIAGINTSISTLNNDLSQTNQNLSQTNQNLAQTNQNLSQTNQNVDSLQENKQDKATAVNYGNISNCITEIPQDIKLELADDVLTLKAGSKLYIPNGVGVFDEITIASDLSKSMQTANNYLFYYRADGTLDRMPITQCFSGASAPTSYQYMLWYDTTNNLMKYTTDTGSTWTSGNSLPICETSPTSINQTFNGFGYVGSTIFALPGVKCLIPDGRNADGSLKNIESTLDSVSTNTINATNLSVIMLLRLTNGVLKLKSTASDTIYYDYNNNYVVRNNDTITECICCDVFYDSNGTILFTPKTPFHAVDYNDTEFIAHQAMPSNKFIDMTLATSGSTYTAPADGYVVLRKNVSAAGQYVQIVSDSTGSICAIQYSVGVYDQISLFVPLRKGASYTILYNAGGSTLIFRFVYAQGSK